MLLQHVYTQFAIELKFPNIFLLKSPEIRSSLFLKSLRKLHSGNFRWNNLYANYFFSVRLYGLGCSHETLDNFADIF